MLVTRAVPEARAERVAPVAGVDEADEVAVGKVAPVVPAGQLVVTLNNQWCRFAAKSIHPPLQGLNGCNGCGMEAVSAVLPLSARSFRGR